MGDPDTLHSYSYTPDVAAALVTLALRPEASGGVWHLPVAPARTTREIVARVYALAGRRPRLFAAGGTTLRLLGLVKPELGEYRHTLYQFTERWVVDDSRFRTTFGQPATRPRRGARDDGRLVPRQHDVRRRRPSLTVRRPAPAQPPSATPTPREAAMSTVARPTAPTTDRRPSPPPTAPACASPPSTMSAAALLAIAGFTALGSVFEYPQILQSPTAEILDAFRAHQGAVTAWFAALAVGAALLAPTGILLGRTRAAAPAGGSPASATAAAAVQVAGLSRWVLLVPGVSADALDPARTAAAHARFEQLHLWLGTVVGETVGYVLTAAFTALRVGDRRPGARAAVDGVARARLRRARRDRGARAARRAPREPDELRRVRRLVPAGCSCSPSSCGAGTGQPDPGSGPPVRVTARRRPRRPGRRGLRDALRAAVRRRAQTMSRRRRRDSSASSRMAAPSASERRSFTYARCVLYGSLRRRRRRVHLVLAGREAAARAVPDLGRLDAGLLGEARHRSRARWRTSTRSGTAGRYPLARPRPSGPRRPGSRGSRCHWPPLVLLLFDVPDTWRRPLPKPGPGHVLCSCLRFYVIHAR